MAGCKDSQSTIKTPDRPAKAPKGAIEASPFSLFAKDLPPITSLHAYAESFHGKLFSPDGKGLPARSRGYDLMSPPGASRSSDGFDVLASFLPSPLNSPPAPAPYAEAGSSASRLRGPHLLPREVPAAELSPEGKPWTFLCTSEKLGTAGSTQEQPGVMVMQASTSRRAGSPVNTGRSFRRRALSFAAEQRPPGAVTPVEPQVPVKAEPVRPSAQLARATSSDLPQSGITYMQHLPPPLQQAPYLQQPQQQQPRPPQANPIAAPYAQARTHVPAPQGMLRSAASMPAAMTRQASFGAIAPKAEPEDFGQSRAAAEPTAAPDQAPGLRSHASMPPITQPVSRPLAKPTVKRRRSGADPSGRGTVPDWAQKPTKCNCKKTRCLKLYCECFKAGQFCTNCNCSGCGNTPDNRTEVAEKKQSIQERDPQAFEVKLAREKHRQGCNCKKSGCAKKYCECFEAGIPCGIYCKCNNCQNGKCTGDPTADPGSSAEKQAAGLNGHAKLLQASGSQQPRLPTASHTVHPQLLSPTAMPYAIESSRRQSGPAPGPAMQQHVQYQGVPLHLQAHAVQAHAALPAMADGTAHVMLQHRVSPATPNVKVEEMPGMDMLMSTQEGSDSAATASPPAILSQVSGGQVQHDAQSYLGAGNVPMVLLPIIQQPSPDAQQQQWASSQSLSPWAQGEQGSGSGGSESTTSPLPQVYQLLLHKTPDGKLVPYGALANLTQVPSASPFLSGPQPAVKQLAFDEAAPAMAELGLSTGHVPFLEVSPQSMPATALLASPNSTPSATPQFLGTQF